MALSSAGRATSREGKDVARRLRVRIPPPLLAISWVIPAEELSLTAGVMQAFDGFFAYFDLQVLVPIVAIALVCASAGGMLTWLAGPSKGLLLIARREGYLPPFFQHQNQNEVAVSILVVQGAVESSWALSRSEAKGEPPDQQPNGDHGQQAADPHPWVPALLRGRLSRLGHGAPAVAVGAPSVTAAVRSWMRAMVRCRVSQSIRELSSSPASP